MHRRGPVAASLTIHAIAWIALAGVLVIAPRRATEVSIDVAFVSEEEPMEAVETVELVTRENPPVDVDVPPPELSPLPEPEPDPVEPAAPGPRRAADRDAMPARVPPDTFRTRGRLPFPMRDEPPIEPSRPSSPSRETATATRTEAPSRSARPALVPCRPLESNQPPTYPRRALRHGLEGVVELEASIDAIGRVAAIRVRSSSGSALLDRTAVETVRAWKFSPATRGGVAVADVITIPVRFRIDTHGFGGSPS